MVEDRDLGWNGIKREMLKFNQAFTNIGIQEGTNTPDNESVAQYAAKNEFGSRADNVPQRSFMRTAFDENQQSIEKFVRNSRSKIVSGRSTAERELGRLGAFHQGQVQRKITSLRSPPNAPFTIAKKGSSNPLIDTGLMRQSVRHVETFK